MYSSKVCTIRTAKYIAIYLIGNIYHVQDLITPEQMPNFVTEKMRAQKE